MKSAIPIIDFVQTEIPSFWVYNNLSYSCLKGEGDSINKLNVRFADLDIVSGKVIFINTRDGKDVLDKAYKLIEDEKIIINESENTYPKYAIPCFYANYKFGYKQPDNFRDSEICWIEEFEIFDFENFHLYPNSKTLDDITAFYLANMKFETFSEKKEGSSIERNNIIDFFNFHLESYKGDKKTFIEHSFRLVTNKIWEEYTFDNLNKKRSFNNWLKIVTEKYGLDRTRLTLGQTQSMSELNNYGIKLKSESVKSKKLSTKQRDLMIVQKYLELVKDKPHQIAMNHLEKFVVGMGITSNQKHQIRRILRENNIIFKK